MPVKNDSIIYCIKRTHPRRNKIYSHLYSIIPGKEPVKEHETKSENEATNKQAKDSTNQRKQERK